MGQSRTEIHWGPLYGKIASSNGLVKVENSLLLQHFETLFTAWGCNAWISKGVKNNYLKNCYRKKYDIE